MSFHSAEEPGCNEFCGSVELLIEPRPRDLGEFTVRRVLPSPKRRMVGPFIFFDHMGPAEFPPGKGIAVRPHPHIGIATITYLFDGEIMHRDSLGCEQPIRPGAVNLMTAGRGIAHSERAGDDLGELSSLHGIQSWIALPLEEEEREPAFRHFPANEVPELTVEGVTVRVIMGEAFNEQSPVTSYSDTLYLDCTMPGGTTLDVPTEPRERAVYVVSGLVSIEGQAYGEGSMAVLGAEHAVTIAASEESRVMMIGGEPVGTRYIWWNFVSSSRERIEQAKQDWQAGNFEPVPGDDEFIPLPDR
jgi:redox-sensitive bicupin YhaK (pirin superfamily)